MEKQKKRKIIISMISFLMIVFQLNVIKKIIFRPPIFFSFLAIRGLFSRLSFGLFSSIAIYVWVIYRCISKRDEFSKWEFITFIFFILYTIGLALYLNKIFNIF